MSQGNDKPTQIETTVAQLHTQRLVHLCVCMFLRVRVRVCGYAPALVCVCVCLCVCVHVACACVCGLTLQMQQHITLHRLRFARTSAAALVAALQYPSASQFETTLDYSIVAKYYICIYAYIHIYIYIYYIHIYRERERETEIL